METCPDEGINIKKTKTHYWKPFLRQCLVSSGAWTIYFLSGLCLGTPTVMIPQIRREANSTAAVSKEMASWLTSVFGYAAIPWVIIILIIVKQYGRKKAAYFVAINTIVAFVMLYFSDSVKVILISDIVQAVLPATGLTLGLLIVSEYSSPKYRGIFLTIKSASFFWGIWVANSIGTFFYWKNIPIIGLVSILYVLISTLIWPESPYWLAYKGRFKECAAAHRWLHGDDEISEEHLEKLFIDRQNKIIQGDRRHDNKLCGFVKACLSKEFYKPNLLCFLVISQYFLSGKLVCSMYAVDIMNKIAGKEAAFKGMLILDGVTVLSMYIGCGLSRIMKRRTLLLTSTSSTIFFLLVLSLYLYLIRLKIIDDNNVISLVLLSLYSVSVCCGPMLLATSIAAELVPLNYRTISVCLTALEAKLYMGTLVKVSPYIFENYGMHAAFLFYAVSCSFTLLLLYLYLPETKDKTLVEIGNIFRGRDVVDTSKVEEVMHLNTKIVPQYDGDDIRNERNVPQSTI